jgi:hypothetical protein
MSSTKKTGNLYPVHIRALITPVYAIIRLMHYTGRFIMFSVITNIYNKKTKGQTLMELFTATEKVKKFFDN